MARELDRRSVDGHAAGARVEPHRADNEVARGVARSAAEQRAQSGQHFLHVEGLGDIVVGAGVDALDLLAPAIPRGQDEDGHRASRLAPRFEDREAVALRQADVEHDRVVRLRVPLEPALLAVERAVHRVARGLERRRDLAVQVPVVFDNQKSHRLNVSLWSRTLTSAHRFSPAVRAAHAPQW